MVLIDVQYFQNVVFSFEKASNGKNYSSDSHQPIKRYLRKILHCPTPHSFFQGWNPPILFWGNPVSVYPPLFEANLKNYTSLSKSHPNWCMQIVWNTLKWRGYISYYTKSIENVIIITIYTFRLNSVFTTDSLVRYYL